MNWILESPLLIGGIGFALVAALVVGFVQTGSKPVLWAALGSILATVLLVLLANWVETETEKLTGFIHRTADHLERNDHPTVLAAIHPSASNLLAQAKAELSRYEFSVAAVTRIHEIQFEPPSQPTEAKVKMNVVVEGNFEGMNGRVPRYVEITFRKSGEEWRVVDYIHDEPTKAFRESRN